jgi:hypothetical protein
VCAGLTSTCLFPSPVSRNCRPSSVCSSLFGALRTAHFVPRTSYLVLRTSHFSLHSSLLALHFRSLVLMGTDGFNSAGTTSAIQFLRLSRLERFRRCLQVAASPSFWGRRKTFVFCLATQNASRHRQRVWHVCSGLCLPYFLQLLRGVSCGHVQSVQRDIVQQLQRRIRVPSPINFSDASWCHMSCRSLQRRRCRLVHQLRRRLRVSIRVDERDAAWCHLSRRSLQHVWRTVMHQLRCRVRLSRRLDECDACRSRLPCRHLQPRWRGVVQQLQRRVRVSTRVDECNSPDRAVWTWQLQQRRCHGVRAVRGRLRVRGCWHDGALSVRFLLPRRDQ